MTRWNVTIPITGYVSVIVEAGDEEDAIEKAMDYEFDANDIEEWDITDRIVK